MIQLYNPYNGDFINEYKYISNADVETAITNAHQAFVNYKSIDFKVRSQFLKQLAVLLKEHKHKLANSMMLEMGKPIAQAKAEIEKCAWLCEYYADNAASFLAPKQVKTEAQLSEIHYEASGVLLAIMPWNYPFWQVLRCLAPAIMLGNTVVLKHADNVLQSAQLLENLVLKAGLPKYFFQHLIIKEEQTELIIANPQVKAVSLTGSTKAGSAVASLAGKHIKKSVLELGGSNALVVFKDADIKSTVDICVQARFQNTGQSCIAGKRLLLHHAIYEEFMSALEQKVKQLEVGNPAEEDTYISVLAREDLAENLENQLKKSVEMGAEIRCGGHRKSTFFEPTLVEKATPNMPIFEEETFGPLLAITAFQDTDEAIKLANHKHYGLGVSLFTKDVELAKKLAPKFKDGAVFINSLVKSHPKLPFGGSQSSGYGRELGKEGLLEFANLKTLYVEN